MEDMLYEVLVTGQLVGHLSRDQAIAAFAHLFCISDQEAVSRFSAAPFVVRGRLTLEQAEKYCRVIRRQGIDCEIHREERHPGLYPRFSVTER
ncbi:MAG: hypothetical protein K0S46_473 [Moraxellaceae bacterium]|jgi:hypothetical protein|nr:hypothetical protein [Moraxellaceae bacterium]